MATNTLSAAITFSNARYLTKHAFLECATITFSKAHPNVTG